MAIAIRNDAAQGSLFKLVDSYAAGGRTYIMMSCPAPECGREYRVYCDPFGEDEVRSGFQSYLTRDHPNHPLIYEIKRGPKKKGLLSEDQGLVCD